MTTTLSMTTPGGANTANLPKKRKLVIPEGIVKRRPSSTTTTTAVAAKKKMTTTKASTKDSKKDRNNKKNKKQQQETTKSQENQKKRKSDAEELTSRCIVIDDETAELVTLDLSNSSKKKSAPVDKPAVTKKDLLSRIDAIVDQESTKQRDASETKPREDDSIQNDRVDSEHEDDDFDDDEVDEEDEQLRPLTIERSLLDSDGIERDSSDAGTLALPASSSGADIKTVMSFAEMFLRQSVAERREREEIVRQNVKLQCQLKSQQELHDLKIREERERSRVKFHYEQSQQELEKMKKKYAALKRDSEETRRQPRQSSNTRLDQDERSEDDDEAADMRPPSHKRPRHTHESAAPLGANRKKVSKHPKSSLFSSGNSNSSSSRLPALPSGGGAADGVESNNNGNDRSLVPITSSQKQQQQVFAPAPVYDDPEDDDEEDQAESELNDASLTVLFGSIQDKPFPATIAKLIHFVNEQANARNRNHYHDMLYPHHQQQQQQHPFLAVPTTGYYKFEHLLPLLCGHMADVLTVHDQALVKVSIFLKSTCVWVTPNTQQQQQQQNNNSGVSLLGDDGLATDIVSGFVVDPQKQEENTFNLRHLMQTCITHCVLARSLELTSDVLYDATLLTTEVQTEIVLNIPSPHRLPYQPPQLTLVWGVPNKLPEKQTREQGKWKACRACGGGFGCLTKKDGRFKYANHIPKRCSCAELANLMYQIHRANVIKFTTGFTATAAGVELSITNQLRAFEDLYAMVLTKDAIRRLFGRFLANVAVIMPLPQSYTHLLIRSDGHYYGTMATLKDAINFCDKTGKTRYYKPLTKKHLEEARVAYAKDRETANRIVKPFSGLGLDRDALLRQLFQFDVQRADEARRAGLLFMQHTALDTYYEQRRAATVRPTPPPLPSPASSSFVFNSNNNSSNSNFLALPMPTPSSFKRDCLMSDFSAAGAVGGVGGASSDPNLLEPGSLFNLDGTINQAAFNALYPTNSFLCAAPMPSIPFQPLTFDDTNNNNMPMMPLNFTGLDAQSPFIGQMPQPIQPLAVQETQSTHTFNNNNNNNNNNTLTTTTNQVQEIREIETTRQMDSPFARILFQSRDTDETELVAPQDDIIQEFRDSAPFGEDTLHRGFSDDEGGGDDDACFDNVDDYHDYDAFRREKTKW